MRELKYHKYIIALRPACHIFPQQLKQRFNFQKFNDGVILDDFTSRDFNGETIETFKYVGEIALLTKAILTLKSCFIYNWSFDWLKARLKKPD